MKLMVYAEPVGRYFEFKAECKLMSLAGTIFKTHSVDVIHSTFVTLNHADTAPPHQITQQTLSV